MYLISGGNQIHKRTLVIAAIFMKLLLLAALVLTFHAFVDLYDFQVYLAATQNILQGLLPWANGVIFYYPPLGLLPCLLLYPIYLMFGAGWFFASLTCFMIVCDCLTTLGVYHLGCKLYDARHAFIGALLSGMGISTSYFVLCRMDPFIICLAILGLCYSADNERLRGYLLLLVGFFSKLYPIVFCPFLIIHHGDWNRRIMGLFLASMSLFGLLIFFGYNAFLEYTGSVYVQTIPYLCYYFIFGASSAPAYQLIVNLLRILAVAIIAFALFYSYKKPKTLRITFSMILLSLCAIILLSNYRSPQYIVWVSPLFALLLADDPLGVLGYYLLQILSFVEFPIGFNLFYTNAEYLLPWAPWFFAGLFVVWTALLFRVIQRINLPGGHYVS